MGWLKLDKPFAVDNRTSNDIEQHNACHPPADHIERIEACQANSENLYLPQPTHLSTNELPYIPAEIVRNAKAHSERVWIVVDAVVLDCTEFLYEHPGGRTVIESFIGEDCSWQFWRFHNETQMRKYGLPLRIGRTDGVKNRFKERPRFLGLRRHGADED